MPQSVFKSDKKKILFIPSLKKGNGTGHFRRCVSFCTRDEIDGKIYFPMDDDPQNYSLNELESAMPGFSKELTTDELEEDWDYIVLDQRNTGKPLLASMPASAAIIALDEGTPSPRIDYLIDLLPTVSERDVNLYDPLLGLDPEIPKKNISAADGRGPLKVLVTFGGEDSKHLTEMVLRRLEVIIQSGQELHNARPIEVTAVQGPLFGRSVPRLCNTVLLNPDKLSGLLYQYDIVIASFGITAFECQKAGVPVLHVNPSAYHTRLSKAAGCTVAGTGDVTVSALKRGMENVLRQAQPIEQDENANGCLAEYISNLELTPVNCPGCGSGNRDVARRFKERTFYICRDCSLVYQQRALPHDIEYDESYFFDEYKNQYGKTYLEDFPHIQKMGEQRISVIRSLMKEPSAQRTLLDIGCAYGPFLAAAKSGGFLPTGIDVSEDAVRYVCSELNIEGYATPFPDTGPELKDRHFDVITMWYVIEHFEHLDHVLSRISTLSRQGGFFCFSTPNYRGISSRINTQKFLSSSPHDHWSIWSAASAKRILARHGYRIRRMRATGVHRSRFPFPLRKLPNSVLTTLAAWFQLGDTFEVYAQKMR